MTLDVQQKSRFNPFSDTERKVNERSEQELAVLRLMYAVSLRLGDEMRAAVFSCLDQHQLMAVSLINRHPGLRQSELAWQLRRSAVQISRQLDELEALGLVERRPSEHDRRSKGLFPTESGRASYQRMQDRAMALAAQVFEETDPEHLDLLRQQAERIARRLDLTLSTGVMSV